MNSKNKRWGIYPRENRTLYNSHFKYKHAFLYIYILSTFSSFWEWSILLNSSLSSFYKTFHWNWYSVDHHEIWHAESENFLVPWIFDFDEEFEPSDCQLCHDSYKPGTWDPRIYWSTLLKTPSRPHTLLVACNFKTPRYHLLRTMLSVQLWEQAATISTSDIALPMAS